MFVHLEEVPPIPHFSHQANPEPSEFFHLPFPNR